MDKRKLRDFIIKESSNLSLLEQQLKSFNIFDVLNISHREIRHSNFIGWLFDPNGNHGFKDYFLLEFMNNLPNISDEILIDYNLSNLKNTEVTRESENNIDIFILNQELEFSITIENKIFAQDSKGQLKKYYDFVNSKHKEIDENYFVYLTPFGQIPKDENMRDVYQTFSYKKLIEIIEKGLNEFESIEPNVRTSIKQYINNVKRNILGMDEAIKIAQKIYQKHQEVIDFIAANKPNLFSIFDEVKKHIENSESLILVSPNDKNIARFLVKDEQFNSAIKFPNARSWDCPYIFAFELHFWQDEIHIKFCFGGLYPEIEDDLEELQEAKNELFGKMKRLSKIEGIITKRSKSSSNYPAIAWKEVMTMNEYWEDSSDKMIDVFKNKFDKIVEKLIIPFVEEFNEKK